MRLEVEKIDTFYGDTQALFGASLRVGRGEVVALLGPSGAGKTTLLRSVLGLTPPRRGRIRFEGRDITGRPVHEIARAGIGWVPEDRRIVPGLTVSRNLWIAQKPSPYRAWTLDELFDRFSALPHLMDRYADNLSGGESQMVAIARCLVGGPGMVLLDEPTQGLAPRIVHRVMRMVEEMQAEGVSVLLVEQNAMTALEVSDRVYAIDRGRIAHEGPAAELAGDAALRSRLLGV